ncbi:prepilin-type N-terminal cleavage/methylation domain-containing protein, partial [Patescibacteria group bacterium]
MLKAISYKLKAKSGFSALEMLLVSAIIVIFLGAAALVGFRDQPAKNRNAERRNEVNAIKDALTQWSLDTGTYTPAGVPEGEAAKQCIGISASSSASWTQDTDMDFNALGSETANTAVSGGSVNLSVLPLGVKEITGGGLHTCALKTDGSVVCWGINNYGQIGDNSTTNRLVPTQVSGLTAGTVKEITAGYYHTCALKTDGSMVCWGDNSNGQIGDNSTIDKLIPAQVSG